MCCSSVSHRVWSSCALGCNIRFMVSQFVIIPAAQEPRTVDDDRRFHRRTTSSAVLTPGPYDLSKFMNVKFGGEEHEAAIAKVLKAAHAAKKTAAIFCKCFPALTRLSTVPLRVQPAW